MKPLFIVGPDKDYYAPIVEALKKQEILVFKSQVADEIDQAGKQSEKCVLIFSDYKFACDFLEKSIPVWGGFEILKILYLQAAPKISDDIQKKLDTFQIKVFNAKEAKNCLIKIIDFYNQKSMLNQEEGIEIEFTANQGAKK